MPKRRPSAPSECPVCGADLPPHARACPECGADERTGWNEDETRYDGLDLPDHVYGENDRSARPTPRRGGLWAVVAIGLVALLIYGLIRGF